MNDANSYLAQIAAKFRDAFTYDPGHSDLDNEQPIHITVTLGDWRRLNYELNAAPQAGKPDSAVAGQAPAVAAPRDQLINALLTFAGPQVLYADLPDEVRRVCQQAADALSGPNCRSQAFFDVARMLEREASKCEDGSAADVQNWPFVLTTMAGRLRAMAETEGHQAKCSECQNWGTPGEHRTLCRRETCPFATGEKG